MEKRTGTTAMETQMEKEMEDEMEIGVYRDLFEPATCWLLRGLGNGKSHGREKQGSGFRIHLFVVSRE